VIHQIDSWSGLKLVCIPDPDAVTDKDSPGLPDGLFSNQKSQFGQFLEGLRLENVDIFYGIWNIIRTL
jgi:hypothetical protein